LPMFDALEKESAASNFVMLKTEVFFLDITDFGVQSLRFPHIIKTSGKTDNDPAFDAKLRAHSTQCGSPFLASVCRDLTLPTSPPSWFYAKYAYDALYAMAYAIGNVSASNATDGDKLLAAIRKTDFQGASGRVQFKADGDRDVIQSLAILKAQKHTAAQTTTQVYTEFATWSEANAYVSVDPGATGLPLDTKAPGRPGIPSGSGGKAAHNFEWVVPQLFGVAATSLEMRMTTGSSTEMTTLPADTTNFTVATPTDGTEYCLAVRYQSRGGYGEFSPDLCLMYEDIALLVDSGTLVGLAIAMVIMWSILTLPVLWCLNQIVIEEKIVEMRKLLFESVLDALELACGFLILLAFKTDMEARDVVLFILVIGSWFNICGYSCYTCSLLRTAAETLSLSAFHTFHGYHNFFTLLVVVPELILETLQYVDTNDMTDLVGVIGLSLDLGVRLNGASGFINRGWLEQAAEQTKALKDENQELQKLTGSLQSEVASLQQQIDSLLSKASIEESFKNLPMHDKQGIMGTERQCC